MTEEEWTEPTQQANSATKATPTEADETLVKIRRHQLPQEDWWQEMLQILPQ